ncbi:MAG TPA: Rid family detoxifying hydrolase [Longimicrobiales bacterium]|nr:Rid family detoxifying hydrolase [Longimicrobiales bacterium]
MGRLIRPLTTVTCAALLMSLAGCTVTASRAGSGAGRPEVVNLPGAAALATYSPAVRSGGLVFLSGQVGLRPGTRELVTGGIEAETRQTLDNVRAVLAAAGLTREHLVKCTVFLADIADYEAMNAVYAEFFAGVQAPARSALGVGGLPLGARVEIECIAADNGPA